MTDPDGVGGRDFGGQASYLPLYPRRGGDESAVRMPRPTKTTRAEARVEGSPGMVGKRSLLREFRDLVVEHV
ncbi:MAG TPA: hypothetical protein VHR72_14570, partial [Gemmataceae bacterium]|nr:hypothetical protein [Gemmataceae bacterium]